MDGTADRSAQRRRAFRLWLFAYPVATLAFTVYGAATMARTDMGEFLLLMVVVIATALAIPVLALIDGARRGAIGAAVGGCLLGIVPAVLLFAFLLEAERAYYDHLRETQRKRVAELVEASARGGGDGIHTAMARLPAEYGPGRALCIVGSSGHDDDSGTRSNSDEWLLPEPDGGAPRVSTARLFDAAEALMQGRSRAQRQAVLAALLVRLSERQDGFAYLPGWLRLWRGTDADPSMRTLTFAEPRDDSGSSNCYLQGDADLTRIVADTWHDAGLRAWIGAGYGFAPQQGSYALDGLRSKAGLDALIAAGLDLDAALRRDDDNGEVMYRLAGRLPQRLDDSADPAALADLVDAYLRGGAELGRTTYGKTRCETFAEAERQQARLRNQAPSPAREAAAQRIRLALCPQGRPPAPTSSSTTAYEDSLEAASSDAVEAARRAALDPPEPAEPAAPAH